MLKEDLSHIDFALRTLNKSLEDTDYIGSARQVGYLDVMIYNELNQLECLFAEPEMREMTRSSAMTYRLENFGAVNNWYRRVQKNPQVSEALLKYEKQFQETNGIMSIEHNETTV